MEPGGNLNSAYLGVVEQNRLVGSSAFLSFQLLDQLHWVDGFSDKLKIVSLIAALKNDFRYAGLSGDEDNSYSGQ